MWLEKPYEGQFSALGPAIGPPSSLWSNPPVAEVGTPQVAPQELLELASSRGTFHQGSPGLPRLVTPGSRIGAPPQHSMLNPQSPGGITSFAQAAPKSTFSSGPALGVSRLDQGRKLLCSNIPLQYLDFFRHIVALFGEADIEELGSNTNSLSSSPSNVTPLTGITTSALVTFLDEHSTAQFASRLQGYHQAFQGIVIKAVPLENIGVALDFPADSSITPEKVSQRLAQFGPIGKLSFERTSLQNIRAVCTFFDVNHTHAAAKSFMSIDGQLFQPRMVRFPGVMSGASAAPGSATTPSGSLSRSPSVNGISSFDNADLKGSQESLFPFNGTRPYFVPRGGNGLSSSHSSSSTNMVDSSTNSGAGSSGSPGMVRSKLAVGANKGKVPSLNIPQQAANLPPTPVSTPQQMSKHMSPLNAASLHQNQQQHQHQHQQHHHHPHHFQSPAHHTPSKLDKPHGASAGSRAKDAHSTGGGNTCGMGKASNSVDVDAIYSGIEKRTTIMLRNIPNKVDLKTLKKFLDETSRSTYDFLYLRIDFSNKCNVGYAFMSFISPEHLAHFVEARRGRKWEKYSSDKVIDMSFANCQGRENLIAKFRNSPVMHADPAYRPKLYYTAGSRAGEEEAFPPPDQELSGSAN